MRSLISLLIAALFVLAALPGGVAGQSRKSRAKARASRRTSQTPVTVPAPVPIPTTEPQSDGVRRITIVDARAAVEKGRAIVVDVRNQESYNAGHVKGARSIPLNDIASRVLELPRDKMIITYCS